MFTNSQMFTTFQRQGRGFSGGWWLAMGPGLFLTVMALAILIWPELLAYMVAGVLLFAGISLLGWGWTLRRAAQQTQRSSYVEYRVY
ncbi:MAG: hypothetical protein KF832_08595 [Caldilineaceae bacterium]|nr:hypothetical protein [Caldilineaceae bacterium]